MSDENEESQDDWRARKEALIFLVDFGGSMVDSKRHGGQALLPGVLGYIAQVLKDKIVERSSDLVAVVAYGTVNNETQLYPPVKAKRPNSSSFRKPRDNISILLGLAPPSAQSILTVSDLASDSRHLAEKYGHLPASDAVEFRHALWHARNELYSGPVKAKKKIVILTNHDNPCANDDEEIDYCRTSIRDLLEVGTKVELAYFTPDSPRNFDTSLFFNEILVPLSSRSSGGTVNMREIDVEDVRLLRSKARKKIQTPRVYSKSSLSLGEHIKIEVDLYLPQVPVSRPNTVEIERATDSAIKKKKKTLCERTGRVLDPDDVRHAFYFMNSWVTFTNKEYREIKNLIEPGIYIKGFKPRSSLKRHHHLRAAYFLRSNDALMIGSEAHFKALCDSMISKDVAAFVIFRLRSAAPRLGALTPFLDKAGKCVGLHLMTLPFAEDMRDGWRSSMDPPDGCLKNMKKQQEAVTLISQLSSKLALKDFDCGQYHNEMIQRYWAGLQAVALDTLDSGLNVDDRIGFVQADEERIDKIAGEDLRKLFEITAGVDFDVDAAVAELSLSETEKKKRAAEESKKRKRQEKETTLRTKLEGEGVDYKRPDIGTANTTQMGDLLVLHGELKGGTKLERAARLRAHLEGCTCEWLLK